MKILSSLIVLYFIFDIVYSHGKRFSEDSMKIHNAYEMAVKGGISKRQVSSCSYSAPITCNVNQKYSNLDGSCNNINHPYWGRLNTPLVRSLPAEYRDGVQAPRTLSVTGAALPSARTVSKTVHIDTRGLKEPDWTHIFTIWGQFLTHDIAETAIVAGTNGSRLDCPCGSTDTNCFSAANPTGDVLGACMNFARSSGTTNLQCSSNQREHLNIVTSSIDLSQVYGSGVSYANRLRSFVRGQLLTTSGIVSSLVTTRSYLPFASAVCTGTNNPNMKCFLGGEDRTSENLGLSGVHTLFLREHNRIATILSGINPSWTDEILFQETRRIMIAMFQHITYHQFIPGTIGRAGATTWGITAGTTGYFTGYNSSIDISLGNEFSTAAMRYGHSTIENTYSRYTSAHRLIDSTLQFQHINFKSEEAYNTVRGGLDTIFFGLLNEQCARSDLAMASNVQNNLLDFPGRPQLIDLAAYNIQRARDHGIAGYTKYLQRCTGRVVTNWNGLTPIMTAENIALLQRVYTNVQDIDLFTGGLAETVTGAADVITSPTFTCLIGQEFRNLRYGDRFYYENVPSASLGTSSTAFTPAQLTEIRKITASRMICNNFDVATIQPNIFFTDASRAVATNTKVACTSLPQMDFTAWRV